MSDPAAPEPSRGSERGQRPAEEGRIPDVTAMALDEARQVLAEAGLTMVEVKVTQPPRGAASGAMRVVRQRRTVSGIELVAAAAVPLPETEESDD